jgi:hypothetical protein
MSGMRRLAHVLVGFAMPSTIGSQPIAGDDTFFVASYCAAEQGAITTLTLNEAIGSFSAHATGIAW